MHNGAQLFLPEVNFLLFPKTKGKIKRKAPGSYQTVTEPYWPFRSSF